MKRAGVSPKQVGEHMPDGNGKCTSRHQFSTHYANNDGFVKKRDLAPWTSPDKLR
jgi:hypothetical protein